MGIYLVNFHQTLSLMSASTKGIISIVIAIVMVTRLIMTISSASSPRPAPINPMTGRPYPKEIAPSFPGGPTALETFIKQNKHYPEGAPKITQERTVCVRVVVSPTGGFESISIFPPIPPYSPFDEEARRIVGAMPAWIPGTTDGRTTSMEHMILVKFEPNEYPGK